MSCVVFHLRLYLANYKHLISFHYILICETLKLKEVVLCVDGDKHCSTITVFICTTS